jgi:hypothetical protein
VSTRLERGGGTHDATGRESVCFGTGGAAAAGTGESDLTTDAGDSPAVCCCPGTSGGLVAEPLLLLLFLTMLAVTMRDVAMRSVRARRVAASTVMFSE